ncbi:hypothetical protein D3C76_1346020 [compost metagenome]
MVRDALLLAGDFLDQARKLCGTVSTVGPLPAGGWNLLQVAADRGVRVAGGCGDPLFTFPGPGVVDIGLLTTGDEGVQFDAR